MNNKPATHADVIKVLKGLIEAQAKGEKIYAYIPVTFIVNNVEMNSWIPVDPARYIELLQCCDAETKYACHVEIEPDGEVFFHPHAANFGIDDQRAFFHPHDANAQPTELWQ